MSWVELTDNTPLNKKGLKLVQPPTRSDSSLAADNTPLNKKGLKQNLRYCCGFGLLTDNTPLNKKGLKP